MLDPRDVRHPDPQPPRPVSPRKHDERAQHPAGRRRLRLVPPRDAAALADAVVAVAQTRPPSRRQPARFDLASHVAGVSAVYNQLSSEGPYR